MATTVGGGVLLGDDSGVCCCLTTIYCLCSCFYRCCCCCCCCCSCHYCWSSVAPLLPLSPALPRPPPLLVECVIIMSGHLLRWWMFSLVVGLIIYGRSAVPRWLGHGSSIRYGTENDQQPLAVCMVHHQLLFSRRIWIMRGQRRQFFTDGDTGVV